MRRGVGEVGWAFRRPSGPAGRGETDGGSVREALAPNPPRPAESARWRYPPREPQPAPPGSVVWSADDNHASPPTCESLPPPLPDGLNRRRKLKPAKNKRDVELGAGGPQGDADEAEVHRVAAAAPRIRSNYSELQASGGNIAHA
jgi:hypothetical protein